MIYGISNIMLGQEGPQTITAVMQAISTAPNAKDGFSLWVSLFVCLLQLVFFVFLLFYARKINLRFGKSFSTNGLEMIIENEIESIKADYPRKEDEESFSRSTQELRLFLRPLLYNAIKMGRPVNWDQLDRQLLAPATRNEELARMFTNNIIILGLFGTATSIAYPIFIGGAKIENILKFVPQAFIPAAWGLFLAIISSCYLAYRANRAETEAEVAISKLKETFPSPTSFFSLLSGNFPEELKTVFEEFPKRFSDSFEAVQENLRQIGSGIADQLSKVPESLGASVEAAGKSFIVAIKEGLQPYEEFLRTLIEPVRELSLQLPAFRESVQLLTNQTQILQDSIVDFSQQLIQLVNHAVKNQEVLDNLAEKLREVSGHFSSVIDSSKELLIEVTSFYSNIHDDYLVYVQQTYALMQDHFDRFSGTFKDTAVFVQEEIGNAILNMSQLLDSKNEQRQEFIEKKFNELVTELYQKVDARIQDSFIREIRMLEDFKQSFDRFNGAYREYADNLGRYTENISLSNEQFKNGAVILESALSDARTVSDDLKIWWEALRDHKDVLKQGESIVGELREAVRDMRGALIQAHQERTVKLRAILDRINGLRQAIDFSEQQGAKTNGKHSTS